MSLNDDVEAEIGRDADYLTTGDGEGASQGDALMVSDPTAVVHEDLEAELRSLDGMEVEIQTTVDGVTRLHDLKEVSDLVLTQESISLSDAEQVDMKIGGLFESVTRKEFTEVPTRANLAEVRAYVADKSKAESDVVYERHAKLMATTFETAIGMADRLMGVMLPATIEAFNCLRTKSLKDIDIAVNAKNMLYYKRNSSDLNAHAQLVDLRNLMIYPMDLVSELDTDDVGFPEHCDLASFYEVILSSPFKMLMSAADMASGELVNVLRSSSGADRNSEVMNFSYLDILGSFSQGKVYLFLSNAMKSLKPIIEEAKCVRAVSQEESTEIVPLAVLREQLSVVSSFYSLVIELEKYRAVAHSFALRSEPIIEAYGKLIRK
jgi:hypothetical protein